MHIYDVLHLKKYPHSSPGFRLRIYCLCQNQCSESAPSAWHTVARYPVVQYARNDFIHRFS